MALTTTAQVQAYLGIPVESDTRLDAIVAQVNAVIAAYCRRTFESATYTEYQSGGGGDLWLANDPVTTLTSVHLKSDMYFGQNAPTSDDLLVQGTDYIRVPEPGETLGRRLRYINMGGSAYYDAFSMYAFWGRGKRALTPGLGRGQAWPNGDGNIKIVYVAGYSTIPPDVVLAANMLAAYMLKMAETSGLIQTSQSLGPHSEAFDTDLFKIGMQAFSDPVDPAGVVGLLKPYRRLPWSSMQ